VTLAEAIRIRGNHLHIKRGNVQQVGNKLTVLRLLPIRLSRQAEHHLARRVHTQKHGSISLVSHG
jgi:hypothetical protein